MPIDYIKYLRGMIKGSRCLSVGLSCLIINDKEEVLLEKRRDNGLYCLPGGSIDLDETVIEGVKREVREETGIELLNPRLFMIRSGKKNQITYPNGDVTDYVDIIFIERVSSLSVPLNHDDESTEIFFCSLSSLPSDEEFLRGTKEPIVKYLQKDFEVEVD